MNGEILAGITLWYCIGAIVAFADGSPTKDDGRGPAGNAIG